MLELAHDGNLVDEAHNVERRTLACELLHRDGLASIGGRVDAREGTLTEAFGELEQFKIDARRDDLRRHDLSDDARGEHRTLREEHLEHPRALVGVPPPLLLEPLSLPRVTPRLEVIPPPVDLEGVADELPEQKRRHDDETLVWLPQHGGGWGHEAAARDPGKVGEEARADGNRQPVQVGRTQDHQGRGGEERGLADIGHQDVATLQEIEGEGQDERNHGQPPREDAVRPLLVLYRVEAHAHRQSQK